MAQRSPRSRVEVTQSPRLVHSQRQRMLTWRGMGGHRWEFGSRPIGHIEEPSEGLSSREARQESHEAQSHTEERDCPPRCRGSRSTGVNAPRPRAGSRCPTRTPSTPARPRRSRHPAPSTGAGSRSRTTRPMLGPVSGDQIGREFLDAKVLSRLSESTSSCIRHRGRSQSQPGLAEALC